MAHHPPSPHPASPARRRRLPPAVAAAVLLLAAALPARAQATSVPSPEASAPDAPAPSGTGGVAEWAVYGGVFDLAGDDQASELGVEARFRLFHLPLGSFRLPIEPALGAMGTSESSGYAYFSLRLPLQELGRSRGATAGAPPRWRVVAFTGGGVYSAGDGKDLGGPVEFRSGLELGVRTGERWWVGLSYYHLSNAVLYDHNPGEESLVLVVSRR